ncbi:hypothetical protein BC830DRAFT_1173215, partial [Chytriomyces sp. MP71]
GQAGGNGGNNQGQAGGNGGNNQGQAGGNGGNNQGQAGGNGGNNQGQAGGNPTQQGNNGSNQVQTVTQGNTATETNTPVVNPSIVKDAVVPQVPTKDATLPPPKRPTAEPAPVPQPVVADKVPAEDPNASEIPDGKDDPIADAITGDQLTVVDKATRAKDAKVPNASSTENKNGGIAQPIISGNSNIGAAINNDVHSPQFAGGNPGMDDPASDAANISGPNPAAVALPIVALVLLIIGGIFVYAYVRRRRASAPKFDDLEKKPVSRTVTPTPEMETSWPFSVPGAHNTFAGLSVQNSFSNRVAEHFKGGTSNFANHFKHFNKAPSQAHMPELVIAPQHPDYIDPSAPKMVPAPFPTVNTSSLYSEAYTGDVLETPMTPLAPRSARTATTTQAKHDSMYSVSWTISDGVSSEFGEGDKYGPSGASEYDPNMTLETSFDFRSVKDRYAASVGLSENASDHVRDTIIEKQF